MDTTLKELLQRARTRFQIIMDIIDDESMDPHTKLATIYEEAEIELATSLALTPIESDEG